MKLAIMVGLLLSIGGCAPDQDVDVPDEETSVVDQKTGPANTCYRAYQCDGIGTAHIGQVPGHPTFSEAQSECQINECNGRRCTSSPLWCEPN